MYMKNVLSVLLLTFLIFQTACAGDVITHDTKKLPEAARTFISTYFPKAQVSHIKIESELFQTRRCPISRSRANCFRRRSTKSS